MRKSGGSEHDPNPTPRVDGDENREWRASSLPLPPPCHKTNRFTPTAIAMAILVLERERERETMAVGFGSGFIHRNE